MSYQFTNEELVEINNRIPKYDKYIFFEKRNKYALLIPV